MTIFRSNAAQDNRRDVLGTNVTTGQVYIEGELLVKFRGGPESAAANRAALKHNHKIKRTLKHVGWQHIQLPPGQSVARALAKYSEDPDVIAVEPNAVTFDGQLSIDPVYPNDPAFPQQWGLTNICAPMAWGITTGSTNVIVAVLDTGIYYNDSDLAANLWRNSAEIPANGVDDDGNGFVDDVFGADTYNNDGDPYDEVYSGFLSHGTACAGVIGYAGNNNSALSGLAWNVRIMSIRFFRAGFGDWGSAIAGQNYILAMKQRGENIRAVNMSFISSNDSQAMRDSIIALGNAGIIAVAGAGNYPDDRDTRPLYPVSFDSPNLITVAASTRSDQLAQWSAWGPTHVDLVAPGEGIWTGGGFNVPPYYPYYDYRDGTSFSTPLVVGTIALIATKYPNATVAEIKDAILKTVDRIDRYEPLVLSGGRLNVARALLYLATNQPPTIMVSPQPTIVPKGSAARFFVSSGGTPPLRYQWYQGQNAIADATNETLNIVCATESQSDLKVVVTNSFGSITSAPTVLSVNDAAVGYVSWGANQYGQGDILPDLTNLVALAGGGWHTLALKSDGTVKAFGFNYDGQLPPPLAGIKAVAATTYTSAALSSNGTVGVWGSSLYGETSVPGGLSDVSAIAAGQYHYLALKSNGTVVAWGDNNWGQCNVPGDLSQVVAISAGLDHSLALTQNGTVRAWGNNASGECNVPAGLTGVSAVVAGYDASLALKTDGTVVTWGGNNLGQQNIPSGLSNVTAIAGCGQFLALKRDGTVVGWGAGRTKTGAGIDYGQAIVPAGLSNVVAISGTGRHSFAIVAATDPLPVLTATVAGGQFTVSWPKSAAHWELLTTTNLSSPFAWQVYTGLRVTNENLVMVSLGQNKSESYFRLRKP